MLVGIGRGITMETNYRLVVAPEWDNNADGEKPSPRTRSFHGLSGEFERGLVAASGRWWELRFGREYMQWGGDVEEGLILSRTAGSLDHIGGRVALGRFALSAFHAALGEDFERFLAKRYLAGHRLSAALPRGVYAGVSETVLYGSSGPKWMYFMPLSIYYANQANERTNSDNILYAFDLKAPLWRGIVLSGELLVDDFQYERDDDAGPDRIAFTIGIDGQFVADGRDYGFSGRYTYVDIFTYEHGAQGLPLPWEAVTDYVTGDGRYPWNSLIGSSLGPDADRWDFSASCGASARIDLVISTSIIRRGEGNNLESWWPGRERNPPFPSGAVLREERISASCSYDIGGGSSIAARGGVRVLDGGAVDLGSTEGFGRIELVLDL
jgi:hypothetical protein